MFEPLTDVLSIWDDDHRPCAFKPLAILPRCVMSPAWVSAKPPRLFACPAICMPNLAGGRVLVVARGSAAPPAGLAFVEHVRQSIWVLIPLSACVTVDRIARLAEAARGIEVDAFNEPDFHAWDAPVARCAAPALPSRSQFRWRVPREPAGSPTPEAVAATTSPGGGGSSAALAAVSAPQDVYSLMETSYLDTLFTSQASLVFFPKSTLNRARNVCSETSAFLGHLIRLYDWQGVALQAVRAWVRDMEVAEVPHVEPDVAPEIGAFVASLCGTVRKDTALLRLEALKVRSAQMELILLAEILSVLAEAQTGAHVRGKKELRGLAEQTAMYRVRIELVVDRLCIWQSVDSDASKAAPPEPRGPPVDELALFYTEVVVPFFSRRIPDTVTLIKERVGLSASGHMAPRKSSAKTRRSSAARPADSAGLHRSLSAPSRVNGGSSSSSSGSTLTVDAPAAVHRMQSMEVTMLPRAGELPVVDAKSRKNQEIRSELSHAIRGIAKPNRRLAIELAGAAAPAPPRRASTARQRPAAMQIGATPQKRARSDTGLPSATHGTESLALDSVVATPRRNGIADMHVHDHDDTDLTQLTQVESSPYTPARPASSRMLLDALVNTEPESPSRHKSAAPDTPALRRA